MPSDNTKKEDEPTQHGEPTSPASEPEEPPLTGTLTEEDIREIEASGLTLEDVIRELKLDCEPE